MVKKFSCTIVLVLSIIIAKAQDNETIQNYIKTYCGIAVEEMHRTGVPASIKLAQGILETTAGQSPLVIKSNNHFGIKCKQGYEGPYVLHDDDRPQERFMKYESAQQSYRDHSDFLKNRARYASLFEIDPTNYQGWAYGLKKAGYATNPKYPQILINLIEKYNLGNYTLMGLGKIEPNEDVKLYLASGHVQSPTKDFNLIEDVKSIYPEGDFLINKTKVVYAKAGTSLNDIAAKYKIPVNSLYSINDFNQPIAVLKKGTLVFLQLKRTVSEKYHHEVKTNESIFDIAQEEGVRLESILKYNQLTIHDALKPGTILKLHSSAPVTAILQTTTTNL